MAIHRIDVSPKWASVFELKPHLALIWINLQSTISIGCAESSRNREMQCLQYEFIVFNSLQYRFNLNLI